MYTDYYLKFTDADEATAVLFDDEQPKYAAVDIVGTIYKPTGKMLTTDEGEAPEMAPIAGFHANVRHTAEAPELAAYQVFPETPSRTWA
jgi:hypothetical protein